MTTAARSRLAVAGDRPDRRPLITFAAVAVGGGGLLITASTMVDPGEPFILAAVLLALVLPAVVLTHRDAGGAGVRRLLRDVVRRPAPWWWLPAAAFGLPLASWATAAAMTGGGGARPVTGQLLAAYCLDLAVTAVLVNLWEELAWTGFFQRRAMARWGVNAGSLVAAVFFTAFHLPLAVAGAGDVGQAATNILVVAGVAAAVRLLIGRLDRWTGGSLLTVGVFHASFNATEVVLEPAYDWVRIVVTVAVAVVLVGFVRTAQWQDADPASV